MITHLVTIEKIQNRYNPEHDLPPGPPVTWVEMALLEIIIDLLGRVDELENQPQVD